MYSGGGDSGRKDAGVSTLSPFSTISSLLYLQKKYMHDACGVHAHYYPRIDFSRSSATSTLLLLCDISLP
jgi:hypothetical protein